MLSTKIEMTDLKRPAHEETTMSVADREAASYVEKQTRTRRLFSMPQIFCFSLMYMATWTGLGMNMFFALLNGGPAAFLFNFILAVCGAMAQALSMGELASLLPLAGAQYYWTFHFAPPKYKMLLTWLSGWATWIGYIGALAGVLNSTALLYEAAIQINNPGYESGGWHTAVIGIAILTFLTISNVWLFRLVPWFELIVGVLNIAFFFVTIAVLWVMSPRNPASMLVTTAKFSNWDSDFISWNVGMLTSVWMFVGLESVVHMGEETKNSKEAAPKAIIWALSTNGILGVIIIITLVICMPPLEDLIASPYPFFYLIETATGSKSIMTVLACGFCCISTGCSMSLYSSATRMTWAWARDGGLPYYFGHVDGTRRVPIRAVLLTCLVVTLLVLFNLNSSAFIALGAITSLSSFALSFTYAIVIGVILYVRSTTGMPESQWTIGRWGMPVNVFALVYTLYIMIWLPFPTDVPVTAATMNYSGPVFVGIMAVAMGGWFLWARKNWAGPNQAIVDFVLRSEGKQ
ncbi:amino acid permease [Microdochium bolleyi]|uniref:Amino acid permease n=1 Tax=Microdochium bolleyi TaxID=196109 RepID=A0A136JI71_9PEZI|nr:amino acid permease [Microdochium bolleyi]